MTSFYTQKELESLGLAKVGDNVLISRKASIYGAGKIVIGNNVRIDDFCILSGSITIGSNVHISAYCALYGANGIVLEDFTGISPRCSLFSAMDDFGGDYLIGPVHPAEYTNVTGGEIRLRKYSQLGASCVVFPSVEIGEGCVVGACSMIRNSLDDWSVCHGIPAEKKRERKKGLINLIDNYYVSGN